jgi:hypothetical protein
VDEQNGWVVGVQVLEERAPPDAVAANQVAEIRQRVTRADDVLPPRLGVGQKARE